MKLGKHFWISLILFGLFVIAYVLCYPGIQVVENTYQYTAGILAMLYIIRPGLWLCVGGVLGQLLILPVTRSILKLFFWICTVLLVGYCAVGVFNIVTRVTFNPIMEIFGWLVSNPAVFSVIGFLISSNFANYKE